MSSDLIWGAITFLGIGGLIYAVINHSSEASPSIDAVDQTIALVKAQKSQTQEQD